MAKKTRYSSNNIIADYQRTQKSKSLKKSDPEKYKRQKFISKISSDGTISKEEGQKAAKKGISLQGIQNRNIGDYREAARGFDSRSNRTQVRNPAASRPTFEPLKIKGGAARALAYQPSSQPSKSQTKKRSKSKQDGNTVTSNIPEYTPQNDGQQPAEQQQPAFDTSGFESQIGDLNSRIAGLTSGFQNQLGFLKSQMEQERAAAAAAMQEMQGSFQQALAAQGPRQQVEGIRFADRGTGGATQQQLQRRGLRGTFGRAGDRFMKISSLNV